MCVAGNVHSVLHSVTLEEGEYSHVHVGQWVVGMRGY